MKKKEELLFNGECPYCPYSIRHQLDGTILEEYTCQFEKLEKVIPCKCPLEKEKIITENENSTN